MKFIKLLTGGKRNIVQLYQVGQDMVVRKTVRRSNHFNFYECEKQTLLSLNHTDLGPKLLDYDDQNNSLTMTYLQGEYMTPDFDNFSLLAARLGELHSVNPRQGFTFHRNPSADLEDIILLFEKMSIGFSRSAEKELRAKYEPELFATKSTIHGSLIPSNILVHDNSLYFVDFEMASMNNPLMDVAYITAFVPEDRVPQVVRLYAEATSRPMEKTIQEFEYARYHICALTLALFLKDTQGSQQPDRDFAERSRKFLKHLSTDYFSEGTSQNLRAHFSNIMQRVTLHV
ncbi:MAG: aminoglycoside phosphotransferase family protein [Candidatus Woesearchaeota archaeon]